MNDFWIILTGTLVAINASILGCFLIIRKMAMVGDAISHAVLPGIVVAYFMVGSRTSALLLIGATVTGVLATVLIDFFSRKARIQNDAAIGITYTLLFAVGMILIAAGGGGNIDLDQECVLYGDIALVNLDKIIVDQNLYIGPRAFYVELLAFLIVSSSVILGFKGFKLLSFNEDFGRSLGIRMERWHYFMMALVSLVTVVSFEVVGAILVVGFLVVPPATAQLITRKLIPMILWSMVVGTVSVIAGYYSAVYLNVSITGAVITVSGIIFFTVLLIQQRSRDQQLKEFVSAKN